MPSFKPGSWLLYLNGIETPAMRVDIQMGVNAVPSATVVLAPDRELLRLGAEDRVQVAVFYLDNYQSQIEQKHPDYRLLFEGEIVSWSYQNAAAGRSLSFQAQGHAGMLGRIKAYFMSSITDVGNHLAQTASTIPVPLWPSQNLFFTTLQKGGEFVKRPYDIVKNAFRLMFGAAEFKRTDIWTSSPAAHFFARWARRTNFVNRWAPSPFLEGVDLNNSAGIFPMLKALQSEKAVEALMMEAGIGGQSESLWGILNTIFGRMYYEFTMLPNMPCVTYDLARDVVLGPPEWAVSTSNVQSVAAAIVELEKTLAERKQDAQALPAELENLEAKIAAKRTERAVEIARAGITGRGPANPTRPVRMLNYVTKPQLQYCVPPNCNVMFPSMIQDYVLSENYADQPTRIYFYDKTQIQNVVGGNASAMVGSLLRTGYPFIVRRFLRDKVGQTGALLSDRNFLVYPEEYYKGPQCEEFDRPEWFSFLSNALSSDKVDQEVLKSLADTYAEYEYTQRRGSYRTGAVNLIFNPYIVPGFPGVVFDQADTGAHIFCYIQNVTHSLTADSMSTSVNFSHAQTFSEFFKQHIEQAAGFGERPEYSAEYDKARVKLALAITYAGAAETPESVKFAQEALTEAQKEVAKWTPLAASGLFTKLAAAEEELARLQQLYEAKSAEGLIKKQSEVSTLRAQFDAVREAIAKPDMAPMHPVPDLRVRFQNIKFANEYYTMLFQQGKTYRSAAFDWKSMIGVIMREGSHPEPFKMDILEPETIKNEDGTILQKKVITNATETAAFTLLQQPELLTDTDLAMLYVARPITNLEEYVDFHGDYGVKDGEENNNGFKYWARIFDYTQGPGGDPGRDEFGYPETVNTADTRSDWERRLLNYRLKIRGKHFYKA
jgi:hypothetical protein